MEDLTYICTEKHETRMEASFTFKRTEWGVSTQPHRASKPDEWDWEPTHWSHEGAEPFEQDDKFTLTADDDEYEVGRHYAFTPTQISDPAYDEV